MATSTKVKFKLEVLREKALDSINHRIAMAELEVASYADDDALSERVKVWRATQEERISKLFSQLGDDEDRITDYQLSRWKIEDIPSVDRYDRDRAERNLRSLLSTKSQIEAKTEALVADEEGNISLTKTQLSEFFGL